MKRIMITGPESSGKTSLFKDLKKQFPHAKFIDEYARKYLKNIGVTKNPDDLVHIAKTQFEQINAQGFGDDSLLISDTDMLVLKIWADDKFGGIEEINRLWKNQIADLYLLCKPDIPWEEDELREDPEEDKRKRLFDIYEEQLVLRQLKYSIIEGDKREIIAMKSIKSL